MTATKGPPYKVNRFGVCVGPGGEDYRIGDEGTAERLAECMNEAYSAGSAAARAPLVEVLRECEWVARHNEHCAWSECPICSSDPDTGHAPNCKLAAAIEGAGS